MEQSENYIDLSFSPSLLPDNNSNDAYKKSDHWKIVYLCLSYHLERFGAASADRAFKNTRVRCYKYNCTFYVCSIAISRAKRTMIAE